MNTIVRTLQKSKRILITGLATMVLLVGAIAFVLPADSASATNCRIFTSTAEGYEAGGVYSKTYTVPKSSVSKCKNINVRNVQNQQVAGDHCATFKVQFFPAGGNAYYGPSKKVCSKGPYGPIVSIAKNVANGTKYRIWHNVEDLAWTHTYQIVD